MLTMAENLANLIFSAQYHESLKAYLEPTGLVSEPQGDLTCRGDLRVECRDVVLGELREANWS